MASLPIHAPPVERARPVSYFCNWWPEIFFLLICKVHQDVSEAILPCILIYRNTRMTVLISLTSELQSFFLLPAGYFYLGVFYQLKLNISQVELFDPYLLQICSFFQFPLLFNCYILFTQVSRLISNFPIHSLSSFHLCFRFTIPLISVSSIVKN